MADKDNKNRQAQPSGNRFLQLLKHLFLNNWPLKLIALIASILLWAGLISQDPNLTRDKVFKDVNIAVSGIETMKKNGFIVTDNLQKLLDNVTVTAAVPQKEYEKAQASSYSLRVDLSKIEESGEQELKILSNHSATYGDVTDISPSSVKVNVEEYITRFRIPVSVTFEGEVPDGWSLVDYFADPALITISGPKTLIQSVSRAKAVLKSSSMTWEEGTGRISVPLKLYDSVGNELDLSNIVMTSESVVIDSVIVEYTLYPYKILNSRDFLKVTGSVKRGYELKALTIKPETIKVSASSKVLQQITDLKYDKNINLDGLSETTTFTIHAITPNDETVLSDDTLTVVAQIEPITDELSVIEAVTGVDVTGRASGISEGGNSGSADIQTEQGTADNHDGQVWDDTESGADRDARERAEKSRETDIDVEKEEQGRQKDVRYGEL